MSQPHARGVEEGGAEGARQSRGDTPGGWHSAGELVRPGESSGRRAEMAWGRQSTLRAGHSLPGAVGLRKQGDGRATTEGQL